MPPIIYTIQLDKEVLLVIFGLTIKGIIMKCKDCKAAARAFGVTESELMAILSKIGGIMYLFPAMEQLQDHIKTRIMPIKRKD